MRGVTDLYDAIPKVELHCHVEGTVRPTTVIELARKAARPLPVEDPEDLYRYTSLDTFLAIFWLVQETLTEPADWERIAYEAIVDAAPHGLRYRETFFTPARHLAAGQDLAGIVDGLSAGIAAAEVDTGVRCALICDMDRAYGPAAGRELVEAIAALRRAGRATRVIGIGMDSTELGVDLSAFAPAYAVARREGLHRTGHAGEAVGTGPRNITVALDVLGVERVDHGVAVMEDMDLVRRMAEERIPLTVCPNSNIVIANRFPSLEDHPFRRMREAGLMATINTDDPGMTDLDLGKEYRTVAAAQRLTFDEIAAVALDGVAASWLDDGDKRAMRSDFEATLAGLRPGTAPA
jgi:adenosine deaminase